MWVVGTDSFGRVVASSWTSGGKEKYLEENKINVTPSAQVYQYSVKEMQHFPLPSFNPLLNSS